MGVRLLGIGSPLVDLSAAVSDTFLTAHISGCKGGTLNISDPEKQLILSHADGEILRFPGGAAANTVMAAAELGIASGIFGKVGSDADGEFFKCALQNSGASGNFLLTSPEKPTGYCLTLVTPDAERTMRSNLGASLDISETEAAEVDFSGIEWVLLEGYFVNTACFETCLKRARNTGCKIAVDICSFELAEKFRVRFVDLLSQYADLLFANFEEAAALTQCENLQEIVTKLSTVTDIAVVKCGANGSTVAHNGEMLNIPPAPINRCVVDTTAAGDYYAAGFFYGLLQNMPLEKCGYAGSLVSAEIVQQTGTKLSKEQWNKLKHILEQECK